MFYTIHGERAASNPTTLNFIPPGFTTTDMTHHNIITKWQAKNPTTNTFEETKRELLRIAHMVSNLTHPFNFIEFNPTAKPNTPDYNLLYTSKSDLGFNNNDGPNASNPSQTQRLDTMIDTILHIDPHSPSITDSIKGLDDYTVPAINKFAADSDPKTLSEIYTYSFRNAHRLSWDLTDGTMFALDIGMNQIEEVNIVRENQNYDWMQQKKYFDNDITKTDNVLDQVFPLPTEILDERKKDRFTYPITMYDHNDEQTMSGKFAYHDRIPTLKGKFVFDNIIRGRIFIADLTAMKKADDRIPQTITPVKEIQLYTQNTNSNHVYVTFHELIKTTQNTTVARADIHIGHNRDGELFITSQQNSMIQILIPNSDAITSAATQ